MQSKVNENNSSLQEEKISISNFSELLNKNNSILYDDKIYNKLAMIAEDIPEKATPINISEEEADKVIKNIKLLENELKLLLLQYQNLDDESFTGYDTQLTINDTNELLDNIRHVRQELQSLK